MLVVVLSPIFDLLLCIGKWRERIDVKTLVTQSSIEPLYVSVFSRLSRMDEIELHYALPRPCLEGFGGELGAVVDGDRHRSNRAFAVAPSTAAAPLTSVGERACTALTANSAAIIGNTT